MSSINGVDPIVVDTIKVPTQKQVIVETQKTKVNDNQKDKGKRRDQGKNPEEERKNLLAAIETLNNQLQQNDIPLYLKIDQTNQEIRVLLINTENQELIAEIHPAKVFNMVREFNIRGFTLDELI